jgi:hypothetical protein
MALSEHELALALWDDFTDWEIGRVATSAAWVAVTRRGTRIRVIAAYDLASLRAKLEKAMAEEANRAG